nr:RNA-directed DNA polymerase, eukaryota, reverse transcriptase zinc-binding domain protein [Tanacetum cinerariifolium]
MGSGPRWCKWIRACLSSASISILLNGSPTKEFTMERGLRQGDPLSPFLFLLVAEALQVMMIDACNKGIFKGLSLANDGANISLLQYANDALFIGRSMRKVEDWACVSSKFTKRLTSWKNRLLSIGGRSTLTKSVLGVFLGYKRWSVTKPGLWEGITKYCKGLQHFDISLDSLIHKKVMSGAQTSIWTDSWIKKCGPLKVRFLRLYGLETHKSCKVVNRFINMNGDWISNWYWRRQPTGRSEGDLVSLNNVISGIVLDPLHNDKWVWSLNASESFSVKSLCVAIKNKMFYNNIAASKFTWNSWVPRKVNICVCRLSLDRLPTRSNLFRRGELARDPAQGMKHR